jgi:hypothetical protein
MALNYLRSGYATLEYAHLLQVYRVPNEVVARMGPLPVPGIQPAETVEA